MKKFRYRKGLTLFELALVLLVLGIIIGIVYASLDLGVVDKAKVLKVRDVQAKQLPILVSQFEEEVSPLNEGDTLELLTKPHPETSWKPVDEDTVKDPWNRFYVICSDNEGNLHICSYGKDGQIGGEKENQDFYLDDKNTWPEWLRK
ncbi:MAG: type II secretion system protein GspG [Leptospiraceae bacterium]|nr:type II secretion system protein GspG [Leptospiraceae bacterium]